MSDRIFRSLSWGFHAPGGHLLWWAVAPSQHLRIFAELAFEQAEESDVVLKAKQIERDHHLKAITYTVGTPAILARKHTEGFLGETIGDRFAHHGMPIIAADEDTLNGWKRCQSLFRTAPDGEPWLTIDPACTALVRAITTGLRDDKDPDDIGEPHPALRAFRYGAMSRPSPELVKPTVVYPVDSPGYVMQQIRKTERQAMRFGAR